MPFRLIHLFGGHPSGFLVFWIPLVIFFYELLWEKKKWLYGWLAGLCIFLMALEEPHLTYYSALFTIAFWGYKTIFYKKIEAIKLSVPIISSWGLVALYMFFIRHSVIGVSIAGSGRGLAEIGLFAPSIKDVFQRINPISEKYIYIGTFTGILLLFSIFLKKNKKDLPPFLFYFLAFIFTLALSLGPNFKYFPLYKICYKIIPFFKFPRSPARIITFTSISISLLVGYGLNILLRNKKRITKFIITSTALILICIDFKPTAKIGLSNMSRANKIYQFIKSTHPKKPVLEIPIWPGDTSWSSIYQFYTTLYRIPIINGYSAFVTKEYVDKIFWPLVSINMGILTREQYDLLKNLGVKYILLHEEAYPAKASPFPFKIALENLKKNPYVKFLMEDCPIYLFELPATPPSIYYYPHTISSKTGIFYECEHLPYRLGRLVEDKEASMGSSLFIEEYLTHPAEFVFGPWKLFPPGRYKVIYRMRGMDIEKVTIEITTEQGTKKLLSRDIGPTEINDKYIDYELYLTLEKTMRLEFRIIYYGQDKLWTDYIYILCQEERDPVWFYEAEYLYHIGKEIYDENANGKSAIFVNPDWDPPIDIVFGPYRRYPPGEYKIGFRLKIPEITNNPVCTIKATWAQSEKILAEKTLKGTDFSSKDTYEYHYINIKLTNPAVLEFKVRFKGQVPVYVDCVTIEPTQ